MTRPGSDEAPTVASGQGFQDDTQNQHLDCHSAPHAEQALQSIHGDGKAFEVLRAAAACKQALVCKGLSRTVPTVTMAFLVPMGVQR